MGYRYDYCDRHHHHYRSLVLLAGNDWETMKDFERVWLNTLARVMPEKYDPKDARGFEALCTAILHYESAVLGFEDSGWYIGSKYYPESRKVYLFAVSPEGKRFNLLKLAGLKK